MARLQRRVIRTVRVPIRYHDITTKQGAKLTVEANYISADMAARGFRVGTPREWRHGHEIVGYECDITALI
jgi:hypothetical protein